jgi:drug/metabolite transporter (DMT)-like permease
MLEPTILAVMVEGRWRPGIGDPTVMGWVTVAAYLIAAIACYRAAGREPRPDGTRRTRPAAFWLVLAGLMVALGINKQLDLQSLATQIGRDTIKAWGLYSERRELQSGFILAVALVCAGALASLLWAARRTLKRRWAAIAGMLFILGFVVIRAASFHHVDDFLFARRGGLKWNWILELGGIGIVALAAMRIVLAPPPRPARPAGAMTYHYGVRSE